jgi:adenine-specific DNA-methyltransferase
VIGAHYTPEPVADFIVSRCLPHDATSPAVAAAAVRPTVLDPSCGDGALLVAAFRRLCRREFPNEASIEETSAGTVAAASTAADRLRIVQSQLFGVDVDAAAVETLRQRLLRLIDAPPSLAAAAREAVSQNIVCGDALTGPAFGERSLLPAAEESDSGECSIDWRRAFPGVARAGGFDCVVGNPPYVRERDARELFSRIAATPLGRRWREARMDLWYYFLHRGLDLLKPGGELSFIVSSYWLASRGAKKLIDRLQRDTILHEIVLFDDAPVFAGVQGRHLIFRLSKSAENPAAAADSPVTVFRGLPGSDGPATALTIPRHELFQQGRITITPADRLTELASETNGARLGNRYEVRQGMAENPATVTSRMRARYGGSYAVGAGVFVLTEQEVERLKLTDHERSVLRPYYDTRALGRYRVAAAPTHQVLYLGRDSVPDIARLPHVAAHLARYREILDARRATREGPVPWWQLHWPREVRLFTEPRILSVQMGKRPQFAYAERPTFVGFSVNLILSRDASAYSLPALTGILNSELARGWFERHAKRRGVALEINGHLLREFPLPEYDAEIERQLAAAVCARQELPDDSPQAAPLETRIEQFVSESYGTAAPVVG